MIHELFIVPNSMFKVEYISLPVEAVNTHRDRPNSPTHRRLRVNSETALALSDRTVESLSLGARDRVVKTVGGPQFSLAFSSHQNLSAISHSILGCNKRYVFSN